MVRRWRQSSFLWPHCGNPYSVITHCPRGPRRGVWVIPASIFFCSTSLICKRQLLTDVGVENWGCFQTFYLTCFPSLPSSLLCKILVQLDWGNVWCWSRELTRRLVTVSIDSPEEITNLKMNGADCNKRLRDEYIENWGQFSSWQV